MFTHIFGSRRFQRSVGKSMCWHFEALKLKPVLHKWGNIYQTNNIRVTRCMSHSCYYYPLGSCLESNIISSDESLHHGFEPFSKFETNCGLNHIAFDFIEFLNLFQSFFKVLFESNQNIFRYKKSLDLKLFPSSFFNYGI